MVTPTDMAPPSLTHYSCSYSQKSCQVQILYFQLIAIWRKKFLYSKHCQEIKVLLLSFKLENRKTECYVVIECTHTIIYVTVMTYYFKNEIKISFSRSSTVGQKSHWRKLQAISGLVKEPYFKNENKQSSSDTKLP